MYRTYRLTEAEAGKLTRLHYDGDTYYYDVFETQEECNREENRLANIQKEYEQKRDAYLRSIS